MPDTAVLPFLSNTSITVAILPPGGHWVFCYFSLHKKQGNLF